MVSKFHSGIHDPKEEDNTIYTLVFFLSKSKATITGVQTIASYRQPRDRKKASKKDNKDKESINQVPQLSQDTKWESNKITINITNKSQEVTTRQQ